MFTKTIGRPLAALACLLAVLALAVGLAPGTAQRVLADEGGAQAAMQLTAQADGGDAARAASSDMEVVLDFTKYPYGIEFQENMADGKELGTVVPGEELKISFPPGTYQESYIYLMMGDSEVSGWKINGTDYMGEFEFEQDGFYVSFYGTEFFAELTSGIGSLAIAPIPNSNGAPLYTPTVSSSNEAQGSVEYEFVANLDGSSKWFVSASLSDEWFELDRVEGSSGESLVSNNGKSVMLTVTEEGQAFTAYFRTSDAAPSYDEADAESVTVAFTISNDGMPLLGADGAVLAGLQEEIPYFDLSLYGLERYGRYHTAYGFGDYTDEVLVKRPTVLHAYIWLLERYYLGLDESECGKGTSGVESCLDDTTVSYMDGTAAYSSGRRAAILPSGSPTSLYLSNFWGHDENLMYFVNHAYPLMGKGWGATCDYVLLSDGDVVDIGLFTDWNFRLDGGFCRFDADGYSVFAGDELTVSTFKAGTSAAQGGESPADEAITTLDVAVYDEDWNKVADLEGAGIYSYAFQQGGTYYLMGADPNAETDAAHFAPAVATVTILGAPGQDADGFYLLDSADDMMWFQDHVNHKGNYGAKGAIVVDIDMSALEWEGLGDAQGFALTANNNAERALKADKAFSGELDGRGHTLTVALSDEPLVTLLSGTVRDLTLESTCAAPAAIARYVTYGATLEGCSNACDIAGSEAAGGSGETISAGIALAAVPAWGFPKADITISGCSNSGAVASGASWAGGVLGAAAAGWDAGMGRYLKVSGCGNSGNVAAGRSGNGSATAGGIVGFLNVSACGPIEDCANSGGVSALAMSGGFYAGGIVGDAQGVSGLVMRRCANAGAVASGSYAGGITASDNDHACLFEQCSNSGTVSGSVAGGIVGCAPLNDVMPMNSLPASARSQTISAAVWPCAA